MSSQLTNELHAALKKHGAKPMPVTDPVDGKLYFLVANDLFIRVESLFDDSPFDITETYAAQSAVAGKAGWDDPEMDLYNNCKPHVQPQ